MPPYLVVGLGNPGRQYQGTYHNAGREVVERLLARRGVTARAGETALTASIAEGWALLPETYMNLSGAAVVPFARKKGIPPERVVVVVDDLYLLPGKVRVRAAGSMAGHNGLKSIEAGFGTDTFPRIRVGIGPDPGGQLRADYVLSRPLPEFVNDFLMGKDTALAALEVVLERGVTAGMNLFNG